MKLNRPHRGEIIIYRSKGGKAELEVKLEKETVWLDAHQMAAVFGIDRTVVVKHIGNIYKCGELKPNSTCAKIAQVGPDERMREKLLQFGRDHFRWLSRKFQACHPISYLGDVSTQKSSFKRLYT